MTSNSEVDGTFPELLTTKQYMVVSEKDINEEEDSPGEEEAVDPTPTFDAERVKKMTDARREMIKELYPSKLVTKEII